MHSITLYRVNPAKNMFRFYHVDIQSDLFGCQCVIREWGRIGRAGQTRIVPYPTITDAQAAFEKQKAVKEKKGYVPLMAPAC
jgi:predicted DNA-binding WGR domain protein